MKSSRKRSTWLVFCLYFNKSGNAWLKTLFELNIHRSRYYSMADIRREIWKADPYHLVFGAVARCYGGGAWYPPTDNPQAFHTKGISRNEPGID